MNLLVTTLLIVLFAAQGCAPLPQKIHDKTPTREEASQKSSPTGIDLGFRYSKKLRKCLDEEGKEGLNPGLLGACSDINSDYFPNGLTHADLQNIILDGSQISIGLDQALLNGSKMRGVRFLKGASLEGATLEKTDFSYASLTSLSLRSAKLTKAKFLYTDLTEADFSQATLTGSLFVKAQLAGAKFEGADLTNARFTAGQFDEASLNGAVTENMEVCEWKTTPEKLNCKPAGKN